MLKQFIYIRAAIIGIVLLGLVWPPGAAAAEAAPLSAAAGEPLIITEIQPGSPAGAAQEFIELYNRSARPVDLDAHQWRLEIASSTAVNWQRPYRTVRLHGIVPAGGYYVAASTYTADGQKVAYLAGQAAASFSAGLTAAAGHVRLVYAAFGLHADNTCAETAVAADTVEWSAAADGIVSVPSVTGRAVFMAGAGIAPALSLQRVVDQDEPRDTDNDAADFTLAPATPAAAPAGDALAALADDVFDPDACQPLPAGDTPPAAPPAAGSTAPPSSAALEAPVISELLPNPAAPLTDAAAEFVELYNPNAAPYDIGGYMLEAGLVAKHRYTFPAGTVLAPHSYTAFTSGQTGVSLTNSGGQVWLHDDAGAVIAGSPPYGAALEGLAWVHDSGGWRWSTAATPGGPNNVVAVLPPVKPQKAAPPAKKAAAKSSAVKAAAAKAVKSSAKPKAKPAEQQAAAPAQPAVLAAASRNPVHGNVLVAVISFALLYGAYEYRHDIAQKLYQFRSNRTAGRAAGPGPEGRGGD